MVFRIKTCNYQHEILHLLHDKSMTSGDKYKQPDLVETALEIFDLSNPSMYRIIDAMVLRGWIDATPINGSTYQLSLTEKGLERMQKLCLEFERTNCLVPNC